MARRPLPPGYGVIWTTVAIDLVGFGIVLPILPLYAQEFGAGPGVATAIVATFSLAQFVAAPLWGRLSDRIGRKPVLILALCGSMVGSLVTGLAGALPLLFIGRIIDGASGTSYAVAQAAVSDLSDPRDRPRLLGMLGAAFGIGFVAGPVIGSLAAFGGPRLPFFLAAGLAGANAVVALVRLPETGRTAEPVGPTVGSRTGDAEAVGDVEAAGDGPATVAAPRPVPAGGSRGTGRPLWVGPSSMLGGDGGAVVARLALIALVGMLAFSGFESTFALLLDHRFGLETGAVYALFAGVGLFLVFVQARLVGVIHAWAGERQILKGALALDAAGLALLAVDGGWVTLAPALALLTLGQGLLGPTLSSATAGQVAPRRRGEALGLQQSAGALGRVIGPLAAGALFQGLGAGAPYVAGAALAALAVTIVPRLRTDPDPVARPTIAG